MTTPNAAQDGLPERPLPQWKQGDEFLPYHPQASHINPDHRDGWNACYRAAQAAQPCIMCHGQGWHYMADAYLPGQGEAPKIKVKCNQCKVQAAQPTRKALSDAEIAECLAECDTTIQPRYLHKIFARAVEAAHGIHPAGKEAG